MKETANIWEYKVGINATIANLLCLWKCRIDQYDETSAEIIAR